ncbi:DNA-processing protein DprA [Corynebacterium tapiri]|uniref:DNA-protecting protein DprA n=1 Tax=Corynebacterium tapiri TaxID=1448266 RepID=A0A5C4U6K7_9CORY|nr:DNA-processing protein DprA [Corynebacterium tapiri]TNL99295.1 DNA-protecting protein DprA [Corynebacterium tapiri]
MSSLKSWAYLSRAFEGPSREVNRALEAGFDADEIARGIKTGASWAKELVKEAASRHMLDRAQQDLEIAHNEGARLISPEDEEWPSECLDTAFGFAATGVSEHVRTYQSDAVAPHALWVKGDSLATLTRQAVAIVGTRAATQYGQRATEALVTGLVSRHYTIISGGALGIDAIAHRAALDSGGPTIAVSACGIDRTYPKVNAPLFARATVVTEYPPETTPHRHRFLTRNRLVAALSQGTVVVEAAFRSGALNTLSWAEGLGRVAMAVPGPITSGSSVGCHMRIRNGQAQLVASADDVRALVEPLGSVDPDAQLELDFAATPVQRLSRNELRVYDALSPHQQVTTEEVARTAGLSVGLSVSLLMELESRGLVRRDGTTWGRS